MQPNLSFEQAPPISVPFRFFLTAPWFGVAAGLLLAWAGEDALASRWSPAALALVHLLVTGFMLQAMCGALLQFVPVAAGGNVWRPRLVAAVVHPALVIGSICLVTAFMLAVGTLFAVAAAILGVAIAGYALVVGHALLNTPARGPTVMALRLAVLGLAVTVALGGTAALALGTGSFVPVVELTDVHAAWGLGGWALMLLMGVSYYVVPMFQLTPPYPPRLAWGMPLATFLLLGLWSLQLAGLGWQTGSLLAGVAIAAVFAATTLVLQYRRRRKVADVTLQFFRGAMACLIVIALSEILFAVVPSIGGDPRAAVWIGVLAIPGVFVSAIGGMLYKIVPFLNWLHLQQLNSRGAVPVNMRDMISEKAMRGHIWLHFLAVAALLGAVILPILASIAGLMFAGASAWLGINLIGGMRSYARIHRTLVAAPAS